MLFSCDSTQEKKSPTPLPQSDYIIDEVEEFDFDDLNMDEQIEDSKLENSDSGAAMKGASFKITISSSDYKMTQLRHFNMLQAVRDANRETDVKRRLAQYDKVETIRVAHVLISIYPSSGRLKQYRIVKSTYIRELDTLIMKDLASLRFKPVRNKIPSVIYMTYVVRLYDKQ